MVNRVRFGAALAAIAILSTIVLVACNGSSGSGAPTSGGGKVAAGEIKIDGSTTVYPISEVLADAYGADHGEAEINVGRVGTGSGMKKFIAGEIDIAGASRPIKDDEDAKLKEAGIEYLEIPIAYDGISVVVHPENTWATNMTVADLKKAFEPGSTVQTWKDINPAWPAEKINFYGPSENHGTFEYFTEVVIEKKNEIRKDYQANQEYTAVIQGVGGDKNGLGYVGFNYYDENKDKVKAVTIDGVAPSAASIEDGTYKPLSRPLFLYVSKKSYDSKPEVKDFVEYFLTDEGMEAVSEAKYVKLPGDVIEKIRQRVQAGTTGSVFMSAAVGSKVADVLK